MKGISTMMNEELIQEVIAEIHSKMSHSFLNKHIDIIEIDSIELQLLVFILLEMECSHEQVVHYATTIALIQIALDTHEGISNQETTRIHKQLTVLAGDYYSGWYYQLLAESNDVQLIRVLSEGIKEINELKIKLFVSGCTDVVEMLECLKQIEISLIKKLCQHFGYQLYIEEITEIFLLNRLQAELSSLSKNESTSFVEAMKKVSDIEPLEIISSTVNNKIVSIKQEVLQNNVLTSILNQCI